MAVQAVEKDGIVSIFKGSRGIGAEGKMCCRLFSAHIDPAGLILAHRYVDYPALIVNAERRAVRSAFSERKATPLSSVAGEEIQYVCGQLISAVCAHLGRCAFLRIAGASLCSFIS